MRITYLIGNGFDLNLGLRTKYTDFLEVYKQRKSDNAVLNSFKCAIENNLQFWANAELAFGEYTNHFNNVDDFCDCHADFCTELATYLSEQESQLNYDSLKSIIPSLFLESIQSIQTGFREEQRQQIQKSIESVGEGFVYNFISFNYTRTLDKCKNLAKVGSNMGKRRYNGTFYDNSFGQLLHVHGFINKDMVLGVNDESQIKNMGLFAGHPEEYIGQIIKRKTNQLSEEHMDEKCAKLIDESNLIYICGMSIGKTDAIWWQRICAKLSKSPTMRVIIYTFDAPKEQLIRTKYLQYERKIREMFTSYSDLSDDLKKTIMNRIHITSTNIFEPMKDLVSREENKPKALAHNSTN